MRLRREGSLRVAEAAQPKMLSDGFLRGWDDSRGVDNGRSFGSAQTDELKSHTHDIVGRTSITSASANVGGVGGTTISTSFASQATGGTETRPRNVALLACIKY